MKVKKAFCGGTLSANPLSCAAGYFTLEEIDRTNACQKAGEMGDRITKGLQEVIEKRLANAEGEIARAGEYMFKVTNDDLGHAFKRLCDLIDALSGRM